MYDYQELLRMNNRNFSMIFVDLNISIKFTYGVKQSSISHDTTTLTWFAFDRK